MVNSGQKIVSTFDRATTAANIVKFVGQETKTVRWTGLKTAGVIADITGLASIGYDVRDGINDYKAGNYGLAIWDGVKGVGTAGFLLFGSCASACFLAKASNLSYRIFNTSRIT